MAESVETDQKQIPAKTELLKPSILLTKAETKLVVTL